MHKHVIWQCLLPLQVRRNNSCCCCLWVVVDDGILGSRETLEESKSHRKVKSTGTIELQNIVSASKASSLVASSERGKNSTSTSFEDTVSKIWKRLESIEMRLEDLQKETLALRVEQEKLCQQFKSLSENQRRR